MPNIKPPNPPYLGPAANHSGSGNKPIHRIVIHSTVSPCEPGGARNIAAYFRSESAGGSAHYVVDPAETVQSVYDGVIAWHAPPNSHSIGIEMCDYPSASSAKRWRDGNHRRMLRRVARLTARLCLAYDVPIRFLSPADLKAGKHGITTHSNVSRAFRQSSHWDPGAWPRRAFMRQVQAAARDIQDGKPDPDPPSQSEPGPRARADARKLRQARERLKTKRAKRGVTSIIGRLLGRRDR